MRDHKVYGVGIVGAGMIAHFHAAALSEIEEVMLKGVYAPRVKSRDAFVEKWPCEPFTKLDELLDSDNVDLILIATPSGTHGEITKKAAQHGVHVLCEKPLEINTGRIDEMIAVCKKHQVLLGGIFNRRFNPAVEQLKFAVDHKRFGQLTICDAQIKWYRTQEYYDSGGWRGTWALDGGGVLMNQAIHTIDQLIYLAGPILRLSAITKKLTHENIEVEDNAVAMVEFESGAIGTIQASTSCWSLEGHAAQINLSGTKGSVFMHDDRFSLWQFDHDCSQDSFVKAELMLENKKALGANDPNAIDARGHIANIKDFVNALNGDVPLSIDGGEARKAVQVIEAIYTSVDRGGQWIEIK